MLIVGWPAALLAATAVHAGFQLTVTLLVYPALGDVEPLRWREAHARHSRRIVPIVGVVYLGLLVTVVGNLIVGFGLLTVVAAVASGLVLALTAFVAARCTAVLRAAGMPWFSDACCGLIACAASSQSWRWRRPSPVVSVEAQGQDWE